MDLYKLRPVDELKSQADFRSYEKLITHLNVYTKKTKKKIEFSFTVEFIFNESKSVGGIK